MSDALSDVDTEALESYLASELGIEVAGVEVLADGLNLVLAISTPEDDRAYVLRRPNKLRDAYYMNSLQGEYQVLRGLKDTAVDAPVPVTYCDDAPLDGECFVMTHVDGEPVPLGSDLPPRFQDPDSRERVAHELVDALAAVHSVAVDPFEDACERWTTEQLVAKDVERLESVRAVTGRELPRLRSVGDWLAANAPDDGATRLVHGDFRPANVTFAAGDEPALTGVLDWETSMLADPLIEPGYLLLRWRDDGDQTPPLDELAARYPGHEAVDHLRTVEEQGLAPFTSKPGSPTRRALVDRYESATGLAFEDDRFYRAYAAFVLALVWEDLDRHRMEAGADPERAPHVDYMAMLAESIVDGELEL
jgi:aminoglycoside phosphotransferase (APT) family kinase protein